VQEVVVGRLAAVGTGSGSNSRNTKRSAPVPARVSAAAQPPLCDSAYWKSRIATRCL